MPECYPLSGLPNLGCLGSPDPSSAAQPVNPACFSLRKIDARIDLVAALPGQAQPGLPGSCIQRPNASLLRVVFEPVPARSFAPQSPGNSEKNSREFRADKPCTRCLNRPGGVVVSEPFLDDRRGPKTHSRRTGRKLGQVRHVRQGLVRVPESNTQIWWKEGDNGGAPAPVIRPKYQSGPQGFPSAKIVWWGTILTCARCSEPSIYSRLYRGLGIALWDHVWLRRTLPRHAGAPRGSRAATSAKVAPIPSADSQAGGGAAGDAVLTPPLPSAWRIIFASCDLR